MEKFIIKAKKGWEEFVDNIARNGIPKCAEIIYKGRNTIYCITTPEGIKVSIKEFHIPKFPNNIIYTTFRESKARRSFENASRLIEMGFDSPTPLGYCEVRKGMKLTRSYYFCLHLSNATTLREWRSIPNYPTLLKELGKEMKRTENAGIYFKDYSPGNILFSIDEMGKYNFSYVDVNRMEFNVYSEKKQMLRFRSISLVKEETAELAEAYANATKKNKEITVRKAVQQLENYINFKRRIHRLKHFIFQTKK